MPARKGPSEDVPDLRAAPLRYHPPAAAAAGVLGGFQFWARSSCDLHWKQAHMAVGGQPATLAAQEVEPPLERGFPYPVAGGELRVGLVRCCLVLVNNLRPELPSLPLHGRTPRGWLCPGQDVSDRTVSEQAVGMDDDLRRSADCRKRLPESLANLGVVVLSARLKSQTQLLL
jgi:hypothetical protein